MASQDSSSKLSAQDAIRALRALGGRNDYSEEDRYAIQQELRAASSRVYGPWDQLMGITMGTPCATMACQVLLDLDLFNKTASLDEFEIGDVAKLLGEGKTEKELKRFENFLSRLLRHLTTEGLVTQVSSTRFAQTDFTRQMRDPPFAAWIRMKSTFLDPVFAYFPEYFKKLDYAPDVAGDVEPAQDFPFSGAMNMPAGSTVFAVLAARPVIREQFGLAMKGIGTTRAHWTDGMYPIEERLIQGFDPSAPLLVDVGGSIGHDVERFRSKFPQYADKLVLQDLERTFQDTVAVGPPVQVMPQDFFQPNQVKNPRAFFVRHILHDWPDNVVRTILRNLRDAAKPGYTKILVNEVLVKDMARDSHPESSCFDIMMFVNRAKERTEDEFRVLFEETGWKLIKLWASPGVIEGIIEGEAV